MPSSTEATLHSVPDGKKKLLLERIYSSYHGLHYLHPDPLEFVYRYDWPEDREIVGLVAAALAIGRVRSILSILEWVTKRLSEPYEMCQHMDRGDFYRLFDGFVYRFYSVDMLAELLKGVGDCLRSYGSLGECFRAHAPEEAGVGAALEGLYGEIYRSSAGSLKRILPDPAGPSACKRLYLYLRWMIRKDEVDPGCWEGISPGILIVPLDTHMLRFGRLLGLTERRSGDLAAAREITKGFQKFDFHDPVRYDFSVTRLGIHPDGDFGILHNIIEERNE